MLVGHSYQSMPMLPIYNGIGRTPLRHPPVLRFIVSTRLVNVQAFHMRKKMQKYDTMPYFTCFPVFLIPYSARFHLILAVAPKGGHRARKFIPYLLQI